MVVSGGKAFLSLWGSPSEVFALNDADPAVEFFFLILWLFSFGIAVGWIFVGLALGVGAPISGRKALRLIKVGGNILPSEYHKKRGTVISYVIFKVLALLFLIVIADFASLRNSIVALIIAALAVATFIAIVLAVADLVKNRKEIRLAKLSKSNLK